MLQAKAVAFAKAAETLASLYGAGAAQAVAAPAITSVRKTRRVSASTRAKMKAAQQARWKRVNSAKAKLRIVKKGA